MLEKIDSLRIRRGDVSGSKFPFYKKEQGGEFFVHTDSPDSLLNFVEDLKADISSDFDSRIGEIIATFPDVPERVDEKIKNTVLQFREDMSFKQKVRETFFASLSALPAILGVSYVLATSDVATGGSIMAHLGGLFGLNDLCALVAIPLSSGLSEPMRKKIVLLLTPCVEEWFSDRTEVMKEFMRSNVTGSLLAEAERLQKESRPHVSKMKAAIESLKASLFGGES